MQELENALGMQQITLHGVPETSHFARVLVAADYRMKRMAMNFDPSPVRGLPSYLQMIKRRPGRSFSPRFWLEPKYEALLRDAEGLAWELRGSGVKALTEEDFLAATRQRAAQRQGQPGGPEVGRHHDRKISRTGRGRSDFRPIAELHGPGGRRGLDRQGPPDGEGRQQPANAAGFAGGEDRRLHRAEAGREQGQRTEQGGDDGRRGDQLLGDGRQGQAERHGRPRSRQGGPRQRANWWWN